MKNTNLAIIGGFLGAGKTTSILSMAKILSSQGRKIGIVTNDQGSNLVDSEFLAGEGFNVLEVTGGCFCCNFDEFTKKVNELAESDMPDIILAEPVGSCTDLIATIFKPFQLEYSRKFNLAPLSIVADPKRVRKLMMEKSSPFPNEINYLFRKQLEEADIIVLNKSDLLDESERKEITDFLENTFKGVKVLSVSALNGFGMEEWTALAAGSGRSSGFKGIEDIDYETYAAAEEHLGWLNASLDVTAAEDVDFNEVVEQLMLSIRLQFQKLNEEIAHLKVYAVTTDDWAKASLTGTWEEPGFNRRLEKASGHCSLIINARIDTGPARLAKVVEDALSTVLSKYGLHAGEVKTECFSPAKPQPKHRIR